MYSNNTVWMLVIVAPLRELWVQTDGKNAKKVCSFGQGLFSTALAIFITMLPCE